MSLISEDLEVAEEALARALGKMLPLGGTGKRMASGYMWIGSWGDIRKVTSALLRVRALARYIRHLETPRSRP